MSNPVLKNLSRNERRLLLRKEQIARASGNWGEWEQIVLSHPVGDPAGWLYKCKLVHKNRIFSVLEITHPSVIQLSIASLSGERPTWHEMQRIKDEIAGPEKTAVEVYPPHDQIVDGADMFHIWVLPGPLPFGL